MVQLTQEFEEKKNHFRHDRIIDEKFSENIPSVTSP